MLLLFSYLANNNKKRERKWKTKFSLMFIRSVGADLCSYVHTPPLMEYFVHIPWDRVFLLRASSLRSLSNIHHVIRTYFIFHSHFSWEKLLCAIHSGAFVNEWMAQCQSQLEWAYLRWTVRLFTFISSSLFTLNVTQFISFSEKKKKRLRSRRCFIWWYRRRWPAPILFYLNGLIHHRVSPSTLSLLSFSMFSEGQSMGSRFNRII